MPMSKKPQTRKSSSSSVAKTPKEKAHSSTSASVIEQKSADGEFAQSGDFFRSLAESSQVCACLKDEAGRYVYASKAFGRYVPQLIGKTDADLFSAVTARELRDHDLAAFMSGGISKFDETTEGVGGVLHWTSLKFPVVSASGQKLLAVICLDVTKQKNLEDQLREGEERYRTIAEITADYAFTLRVEPDRRLTLEWITAAFSRLSGFTQEEIVDREGWKNLPHPEDLSAVQQHHDAALSGQEQICEFRIIAKSGEVRWLRESMRPVWDREQGRVIRIYGAGHDITERKRMEEQLREREIQPKELGMNLRRFRQQLGLTQSVFGQTFGNYSQRQITSYETGEIEIPMGLLLSIRKKGYPLEVVLGESQTDALDKVVGYLSASWRIHETAKRLTESVLRLLDRESVTVSSIMSNLGVSPEVDTNRETFTLRDMLRRAGIEPSLSLETEEERTK